MGLQSNNNNNNSELYLHDYYNTLLQNHRKHDNYSDSVIKVQLQHWCINIYQLFQKWKGQINLSLISKHDEMNTINRRFT